MEPIRLTIEEGRVGARPVQWLGDSFRAYSQACGAAGARFDPAAKCQRLLVEDLPVFVKTLALAGFSCQTTSSELQTAVCTLSKKVEPAVEARSIPLFPFQVEGVAWLRTKRRALLADDMGLGKTWQLLAALPAGARVIAVVPACVKGNWRREGEKLRPDFQYTVLSGRGSFRWPAVGEMVILNREILPPSLPDGKPEGLVLIADECHAFKSSKAQCTKRFRLLSKAASTVWGATGTPLLNEPIELWTVLASLGLERQSFGDWNAFCRAFRGRKTRWGYVWGTPDHKLVSEALQRVMLRRLFADVITDLPPIRYRQVDVPLKASVRKVADEVLRQLRAAGIDIATAADDATMKSIEGIDGMSACRRMIAEAKLGVALELIEQHEESNDPVVVFSDHRLPVEFLEAREGWVAIHGGVSQDKRTEIVEKFQTGKARGFAGTIKAAGVGITLHAAHSCIRVDLNWTPELNHQAACRLHRIGQARGVVVTDLVADHELDARIHQLLARKERLIGASVNAAAVKSTSELPVVGLEWLEKIQVIEPEAAPAPAAATPAMTWKGYYTAQAEGQTKHDTFSLWTIDRTNTQFLLDNKGKTLVKVLTGPHNTSDYLGIGWLVNGELKLWSKHRSDVRASRWAANMGALVGDENNAKKLFASLYCCCYRCGRVLSTPESIQRGIGPECAGQEV
jgi:SWI/SNF-related matrix-associated actin-dependent regulator 1 of chromatin subfamily A